MAVLSTSLLASIDAFIAQLDPIDLGQVYSTMSGVDAQSNLITYRLKKKYYKPEKSASLRAKAISTMIQHDSDGITTFVPAKLSMDPLVRKAIYNVRNKIHEVFNSFDINLDDLEFPSGESFNTGGNSTSLFSKLRDKDCWAVTPDCFELFSRIVYRHNHLRRCAKAHFRRFDSRTAYKQLYPIHGKSTPFIIFQIRFRDMVTFVHGSKITTVPKNNDTDRCINIEAFGNMICQRSIAISFKRILLRDFGLDLDNTQVIHQKMISDPSKATIDLSAASDSNWMAVIEFLYPRKVVKLLNNARSRVAEYGDNEYHQFNMLSPMGNGFTFEVMTTTLLAFARYFDSTSSVFGDDIIIDNQHASIFIELLNTLGYKTNSNKTFIESRFRESCGSFYHDDYGYVHSYEFWRPADDFDLMIFFNKLWFLKDYNEHCFKLYHLILAHVPPSMMVTLKSLPMIDEREYLTKGFIVSQSKRRRDAWNVKLSGRNQRIVKRACSDLQTRLVQIRLIPHRKNHDMWSFSPRDSLVNRHLIAFYFYGNRVAIPKTKRQYISYDMYALFDSSHELLLKKNTSA